MNAAENTSFIYRARARLRNAPARSGQRSIRGGSLQPLARFAAAFLSPLRASGRRESAERETCESRQFFSAPCAHPRDAPARSGKRTIRGGFLQSLARLHETRKRGAGNARFAAAFFSPSCASVRRESAERATRDSRRLSSALRAHPRDAPVVDLKFLQRLRINPSRASARRASAERETHDSRRLSSVPRAAPRNAKARSGQRANRGAFFQPLARIREACQRGVGNARFAAAFFSTSRASARRESAERAKHESRRFSSAPRARPRDAPARSRQRSNRGGFFQPLARIRETRQLTTICRQFAALQPLARIRETRPEADGKEG